MKIAILGGGLLALEALLFFEDMGAELILFSKNKLGGFYKSFYKSDESFDFNETFEELTTNLGRKIIQFPDEKLQLKPSFSDFNTYYLQKIIDYIENKDSRQYQIILSEVLRVHKCFLNPNDNNEGRSRLEDLFRVVYNIIPDKERDLSALGLPDEALSALTQDFEAYKDFDLIIDARGSYTNPNPMGPANNFAINESALAKSSGRIFYGKYLHQKITDYSNPVIVGSGIEAAFLLVSLKNKIFNKDLKVRIIGHEKEAFENIRKENKYPLLLKELSEFLYKNEIDFKKSKEVYEKELFEYRSRPDYERVKYKEPIIPISKIDIISNYVITSVDVLFDNPDVFLSLEKPTLGVKNHRQEEYSRTISHDSIFVANGDAKKEKSSPGNNEPGYFSFDFTNEQKHPILEAHNKILEFKDEILKFFTINLDEE